MKKDQKERLHWIVLPGGKRVYMSKKEFLKATKDTEGFCSSSTIKHYKDKKSDQEEIDISEVSKNYDVIEKMMKSGKRKTARALAGIIYVEVLRSIANGCKTHKTRMLAGAAFEISQMLRLLIAYN